MSNPSSGYIGWTRSTSPYDVLGVSSSATNSEIRKAYRKRALETHPDKQYQFGATEEEGLAAEALFREVLEAFELLNDPIKRRAYDIHSRPHPAPSKHRRTSTETNVSTVSTVSKVQRKTSAYTVDELRGHARDQERSEWIRQEEAAHRAWRAERTKSFTPSVTSSTPIKVSNTKPSTYASANTPKATSPDTSSLNFSSPTSPKPIPLSTPLPKATPSNTLPPKNTPSTATSPKLAFPLSTSPRSTFSTSPKPFPSTPTSPKSTFTTSPPSSFSKATAPKPPVFNPAPTYTRGRSDTASTISTNTAFSNRSRSSTATSTSPSTSSADSITTQSSVASTLSALKSRASDTNIATNLKSSTSLGSTITEETCTNNEGAVQKPEINQASVLGMGYEEWVERILAELYLMGPTWMNKNGPQGMDTNPV